MSLILVNEHDIEIGSCEKTQTHVEGLLHRAVSVCIFNRDYSQILLQKRAQQKYHSGGLWSNACCTHPIVGESTKDAALRALKDELGLQFDIGTQAFKQVFKQSFELSAHNNQDNDKARNTAVASDLHNDSELHRESDLHNSKSESHKESDLYSKFSLHSKSELHREPDVHSEFDPQKYLRSLSSLFSPPSLPLSSSNPSFLSLSYCGSFIYLADVGNGLIEHELDHLWVGSCDLQDIKPNKSEVETVRMIGRRDLERDLSQNPQNYTLWLPYILNLVSNY